VTRSGLALSLLALLAIIGLIAYVTLSSSPDEIPDHVGGRMGDGRAPVSRLPALPPESKDPEPNEPIEPVPPRVSHGILRGVVIGPEGKPVEGAQVYTTPVGARFVVRTGLVAWTTSGKDGAFQLLHEPATTDLFALKPGLVPALVQDLKVVAGREIDVGTLRLDAGLALAGRVIDETGAPVEGVEAVAYRDPTLVGRGLLPARAGLSQFGGSAISDEQGRFRIGGLTKEALTVIARGIAIRMEGDPLEATPGTTDLRIVVIRLRLATGVVIAEEGGKGIGAATVRLEFERNGRIGAQIVNTYEDGRFAFDLSESRFSGDGIRFHLRISADGYEETSLEDLTVEDLAPKAKLRVSMVKAAPLEPGRLRGRVLYDTGAPFVGSLTLSFAREGKAGQVYRIETDEQGDFLIEGVPPGEYLLRSAPHRSNILRETGKQLVITPGGEESTEFTLVRGGDLRLKVVAADGGVAEGATVSVLGPDGTPADTLAVTKGGAVLLDLAPGEVRLRVSAPGHHDETVTATVEKDGAVPLTVHLREKR